MKESFLLTNMCPQDRGLNSGVWNRIESDCAGERREGVCAVGSYDMAMMYSLMNDAPGSRWFM